MKNTLENKVRFFASNLGCDVQLEWEQGWDPDPIEKLTLDNLYNEERVKNGSLLLTPLSAITDEDAMWIANQSAYRVDDKNYKKIHKAMIDHLFAHNSWSGEGIIYMYQYLQSKGYALPYMGLSIEQLIEYGWVKIKTN